MKSAKIIIRGIVQGVFFRASAKQLADSLGVKGWIRNEDDGSVLIEAEGDNLDKFLEFCRKGPNGAEIQDISITEKQFGNFPDFRIV